MWRTLTGEQGKRLRLIGAAGLVLVLGAGIVLIAAGPSASPDPEPGLSDVPAAEAGKDAAALTAAAAGPDERRAAAAIGALARVGGAEARPVVLRAMADTRWPVRQQAVRWYPKAADWTDPNESAPLRQAVATEKSADVLVAGLHALGEMKAWDSLDQVYDKMNHPDRGVRAAAAQAAQDILYVMVTASFNPDDPPNKRLALIASLREFSANPYRREHYLKWLAEERGKRERR